MSHVSPLLPAVDDFLRYLKVERQLSPLTQKNYQRQLQAIIAMADEMKLTSWSQLEPAQVRSLAARSRRGGLGASSLALRMSALRSFLDWQVHQGMLSANPAKGISTPRNARHLPKNMDVDEVNQLLEIDLNDPLAVRDRAMLETMYGGGLRLSELVNMDCRHMDLEAGEVRVLGKGSKERRVPIGGTAVTWIQHWFRCVLALRRRMMRCLSPAAAAGFRRATCRSVLPNGASSKALPAIFIRINCATLLPRICWNQAAICARYRNCSVTPIWRPRKSTPIWISSIWRRFTMRPIRVPNEESLNEVLSSARPNQSNHL